MGMERGEREQLVYQFQTRMAAPHESAAAAVREAENALSEARNRLAHAHHAAAAAEYVSDPLAFMRQSVAEEVETLKRVSNEKRVRASYRFLLDRSVELAGAELQSFHDDVRAEQLERREGLEACREAEQRAVRVLDAAREMQRRVHAAEEAARVGLETLVDKLTSAG